MIIRVEAISLIVDESETEIEVATSTGGMLEEEEVVTTDDEETEDAIVESDVEVSEEETETTAKEEEEVEPETPVEAVPAPSPELAARIEQMASESFSADQWTQQYCTAHIGFCIPVHRNWWFKSFGTTTSLLWHVEISSGEIYNLFDGPIRVDLISGTVGGKKAADGQVREEPDGTVIGYRSWTENRHFEISAPPALSEAVKYITQNLEEYVGE